MPGERDDEQEPEGPHRPDTVRRPTMRLFTPAPEGVAERTHPTQQPRDSTGREGEAAPEAPIPEIDRKIAEAREQVLAWRDELATLHKEAFPPTAKELTEPSSRDGAPGGGGDPPPRPDDRFAMAGLTPDEMQALHDAPDQRAACGLLGQMLEARLRDGRLQQTPQQQPQPAPILDQIVSPREQVELGLRPTPQQLAHLQSGRTFGEELAHTMDYVAERQAENAYWYERGRSWSPEAQREARTEQTEGRRNQQEKSERAERLREARIEQHLAERKARGRDPGGRER